MSDKKSSDSRRKLLKSIAAGSGAIVAGKSLPESWSRPVVDSVMLPTHAQTSPTPPTCCLTDGVYCGTVTSSPDGVNRIDIFVTGATGDVRILVLRDTTVAGETNINVTCEGGAFTDEPFTSVGTPLTMSVSGAITCGATSIDGTVLWDGSDYSYSATQGGCP